MSDSEVETSFSSRMGSSPNSHVPSFGSNHIGPEVIPIFDNFNSERLSEGSLEEETSSSCSLDALISNVDRGINRVEVPMPPYVLS